MRVRFIHRDDGPARLICSAELVFDEGDGPLAGLWLMGFELWRAADGRIAVSLPSCPLGAPRAWRLFEHLRGEPEATARLAAFVVEAYENRGAVWTCPECRRAYPAAQAPAGLEWTCPVCRTPARARDRAAPISDTLRTLDAPISPPARRSARRRRGGTRLR